MSTTKTTSGLTATSLSNKLAVSSGLSTSDLFALDNAKVLSAPGTAKCEEAGANKGYLNAIGAADGTYITISIAGSGAVKGDIVEFYLGGKLAATHELTAIEVSNIATSPATTNTGVKDWSLPPEPKPGVAAVLVSADVLATYVDGKYDMTSRIYSVGTGTYSAISTGVGRLNLDRKAPTAPTAPIATDDVGQLTGVIAQNATTDDASPLISGTAKEPGSSISVYDNGVFLGNAVVSTTGAWTFVPTTPLINGPHAITLIETDIAGNPSPMSAPLNFIVDTGVANVVITHASDNVGDLQGNVLTGGVTDDKTPTLVGTAKANAVVTILEGSTIVGTTTADGQGNWSFTPSGAQTEGTHTYTASTTVAGNTVTSVDFVITVDTVAPNVVVTPQGDNLKTADEATAATGIITVNAELGSTSTVTFVGQHGQVTKTVNNIGSPRPVVLTAADLVTLGDGAVEVTTVTKDKAGNTTTTPDGNDGDFMLDTVAAVAVADVVNATEDLVSTSGNVGTNDTSKDGSETFSLVGSATGLYGTLVLGANGTYTYTRTSNLDAIQTTVVDTFTYQVRDGAGNTTQSTLKINMAPVNDAAVISGTVAGDVVEAGGLANAVVGTPTATGTLTSLDVDGVNNAFTAVVAGTASTGGYGTYAMTANGVWTYKLDNANAKVQGLALGATLQDTFTVAAADGTPKTVTITITGTNDAAVISGPTTGDVIEAGGVANAVAGTPTATGTLTSFDVDGANNAFIAVTAGTASTGGYGTYAMAANGVWTYTLNNNDVTVQALTAGATLNDTFTVKAADGTAKTVTVTISGTNDAAVISGNVVGSVTEASGGSATGTLTSIDVDGTDNAFTAVAAGTASYGTYAMTAGGVWTYTLDNSNPTVQGLTPGATLQDTFTVTAADGTAKTINVTISGTNTAAVISGPVVGAVTEAGGVANAIAGTPTATGTLSSTDVDGAPNAFTAVTTGTTSISGYGTYTMTANGVWTYTLNNNNITVQALTTGAKLQDTFIITAADGTPQTITVTITGTNDAAVISGAITGDVIEAGGVANAVAGTPTATGTLLSSDVDGLGNTFTAVTAGTAMYGTYTMTAGGVWTYKLDNANGTVQGLTSAGKLTDTFTVAAADGTTQTITITINGTNDAAVISGSTAGSVTEAGGVANAIAGTPTATGALTLTDVESGTTFTAVSTSTTSVGGYGKYTMTAAGVWTYTLDNANVTVQALKAGATLQDTFDVTASDGTKQTVTITITGTNDAAVITGNTAGNVVEAGGVANAIAGTPTATGTLTLTDVDGPSTFTAVTTGTTSAGGYGKYTMTAAGVWTYTLDNTNVTVQALKTGAILQDTFDVAAADGTKQTVTITINGTNDAAVISGSTAGSVTEAGGLANATAGTPTATGALTLTDVESGTTFTAVSTGTTSAGGFGKYTMTAAGVWTYTLDNANVTVQALKAGATLQDTFDVTASDGTKQTVTITINGTNDAATITGSAAGAITEDAATNTASGTLTVSDVDGGEAVLQTPASLVGTYGTFTLNTTTGVWGYTLDNTKASVQGLYAGQQVTDTLTVKSQDGIATQNLTVTITGTNDAAVITGNTVGNVVEAGGVANAIAGTPTATGSLTSTDVDGGSTFTAVTTGTTSAGGYGKYTMTAAGVWTYTLDNANTKVQALTAGATLQDTFVVTAADGTQQTVTITINGTNDAAVITGNTVGNVVEAGGVANAIAGTPTATGSLTSTDVDGSSNFTAVTTGTTSAGGYGKYTMTAAGVWTYTLDNTNTNVQMLPAAGKLTDTFTVSAADGTTQTITITINGTNDAAVISGSVAGAVTEAGGVANATAGTPTATGTLTSSDVDGATNAFTAVAAGTAMYGTYTMTAGGVWTYKLDNANSTVQGLTTAAKLTDTFTLNFLAFT